MPYPQVGPLTAPEQRRRLDTCTRGFSDAFGDRLLMFDPATATSLELLRFKSEFNESPAFEAALKDRVEHTHVQDPAIAPARAVERWDGSLLLVSRHVAGRRLSDLLPDKHGPMLALECIRQLVPILAALAEASHKFAHGALDVDRVIASHDGRLTVVEHPLGAAVESLGWPLARLNELGLAAPVEGASPQFDGRIDVVQLGLIALSLLLGRRISPADYPSKIPALLTESAEIKGGETWAASRLRSWLERAAQIGPRPLESAREALMSLGELPSDAEFRRKEPPAADAASTAAKPPVPAPSKPAVRPPEFTSTLRASLTTPTESDPPAAARRRFTSRRLWMVAAISIVAVAEGVVIVAQRFLTPKPIVVEVTQPAVTAAPDPGLPPKPAVEVVSDELKTASAAATDGVDGQRRGAAPSSAAAAVPTTAAPTTGPGRTGGAPAPGGASRFGGMTFNTPLDLQVFENGKRIGASGGPIAVLEGVHSVDLVNETLGFRSHETITVRAGEMVSRTVPVPNGRVSINAAPWADVWVDGSPAGQTPLANLSMTIGEHQVVLRHPQLGEQRHTVVVRSDGVTRLSANMQR